MEGNKLSALLGVAIVPQVVDLIVKDCKVSDVEAAKMLYASKTYECLANENTKVWHFSPLALFNVWKGEKETGKVVWPEEAL